MLAWLSAVSTLVCLISPVENLIDLILFICGAKFTFILTVVDFGFVALLTFIWFCSPISMFFVVWWAVVCLISHVESSIVFLSICGPKRLFFICEVFVCDFLAVPEFVNSRSKCRWILTSKFFHEPFGVFSSLCNPYNCSFPLTVLICFNIARHFPLFCFVEVNRYLSKNFACSYKGSFHRSSQFDRCRFVNLKSVFIILAFSQNGDLWKNWILFSLAYVPCLITTQDYCFIGSLEI